MKAATVDLAVIVATVAGMDVATVNADPVATAATAALGEKAAVIAMTVDLAAKAVAIAGLAATAKAAATPMTIGAPRPSSRPLFSRAAARNKSSISE